MRKSRFSTEQIAQILAHAESGVPPKELCRKYGISEATFYVWRRKDGGRAPREGGGPGAERGAPAEAAGGREPQAEAPGRRPGAGQADPARRGVGKSLRP